MNSKLILAACLVLPLTFTACSKQESAPAAEQTATSETAVTEENSKVTPEQQAAIDALDKPLQDENNTDIPDSVANAPADQATADTEVETSAAQ